MLEASRFLVSEQVRFLKSHLTYEIYDGDTGERIGTAEEVISPWNKLFRWFISKQLMNTTIEVREEPDQALVFTISRGWYLIRSRVEVYDAMGTLVGYFQNKLFSLGGGFWIFDQDGQPLAELNGNFLGFNYRMRLPDSNEELGHVSKQWQGLAREIFTTADTYMVELTPDLEGQPLIKMLLLAAALVTDMIYKSKSRTI